MKPSQRSSPASAPFRLARVLPPFVLPAIAFIATASFTAAAEAPSTTPAATAPAEKVATPIVSSDETVKKNLAELERLLDTPGSKLEELLQKNLDRIMDDAAPKDIPELAEAVKDRPWIIPALRSERGFLLHRYIARRARGPLLRPDVIALDQFLAEHVDIRRALNRDPSQIVEGNFLMAHPNLAEFLGAHPSLSTVLLIPQPAPERGGRRGDAKGK